jgi:AraC-like DNA-binding protein
MFVMVRKVASSTPQLFKTEDASCAFVKRVLPPGFAVELNNAFHDDVVILAFTGSTWLSRQAGRTYRETPGCVVMRDAGQVFSARTLDCDPVIASVCREIHIPPAVVRDFLAGDEGRAVTPLDFSHPVIEDQALSERLIHTHMAFENGECSLARTTCLSLLLQDLAQRTNARSAPRRRRGGACHRKVIEYMRENYGQEITLQALSDIAKVNPFGLLRSFRDEYDITPHQYLRTYRVNQAMRCIREGMRLADVALLCGFSDQSHMNRQFKRTVGVSPGQYFARALM